MCYYILLYSILFLLIEELILYNDPISLMEREIKLLREAAKIVIFLVARPQRPNPALELSGHNFSSFKKSNFFLVARS